MCYCVNTTTGHRLNGMPRNVPVRERDTINCTEGELIRYATLAVRNNMHNSNCCISTLHISINFYTYTRIKFLSSYASTKIYFLHVSACIKLGTYMHILVPCGLGKYIYIYLHALIRNAHSLE